MDLTGLEQIIAALITLISLILAWYENQNKKDAQATTAAVVQFYDPATAASTPKPEVVTAAGWTMSDSTKRWLTFGESEADKALLLQQVAAAETAGKAIYTVTYSRGTYEIEYGLIKGGTKYEQ